MFSDKVMITGMVLEAIGALGYLLYAAGLLVAASMENGVFSCILYALSALIFFCVIINTGGYTNTLSLLSKTRSEKSKP